MLESSMKIAETVVPPSESTIDDISSASSSNEIQ